jgi:hypothetical protein
MITAIDFGNTEIRVAMRSEERPYRLRFSAERAAYRLIPDQYAIRSVLDRLGIPCVTCENSIAVIGNQVTECRWLNQLPLAPLLDRTSDGTSDLPARQMINLLVESLLPKSLDSSSICAMVLPESSGAADSSQNEFLRRLVRMRGYEVLEIPAAEAAILSTGSDFSFTGCCVVMGAEETQVCIARNGVSLVTRSLPQGGSVMDRELCSRMKIHVWDREGNCYLDVERAEEKKTDSGISLMHPAGDFQNMLSELYADFVEQILGTVGSLLEDTAVARCLPPSGIPLILTGGASAVGQLKEFVAERLIRRRLADRIDRLFVSPENRTAVLRGALIAAELASKDSMTRKSAA